MASDPGRWRRIAVVTLAMGGVGAVMGATIGAILVGVLALTLDRSSIDASLFWVGARFGAAVGFVFAPIAAWTLMRRVPLWRAIGDTAIGTTLGAGLGLILQDRIHSFVVSPVTLGVAGFVLAALRLRMFYRTSDQKAARGESRMQ